MAIPSEINTLINQLSQELNQIEQEATEGLNLTRSVLSRFPDNDLLIQFFAYLNDVLLFVDIARGQIQATIETISPDEVPAEIIQEAGEDLGTPLGRVLEAKISVRRIVLRLQSLS